MAQVAARLAGRAWAAWYAAVLIGFGLYSVAEALCPPNQVISGMCVANLSEATGP
jgi:hypothetical protein